MTGWVVLLRAVNVGGTGRLAMADLRRLCGEAGHRRPRTHIASGNVVFASDRDEQTIVADLEERLAALTGQHIGVLARTAAEIARVRDANPFPDGPGNRTVAIFLPDQPEEEALAAARHVGRERLALGERAIYVAYDEGMGRSRLVIPAASAGTARNMNTVAKLAAMAAEPL